MFVFTLAFIFKSMVLFELSFEFCLLFEPFPLILSILCFSDNEITGVIFSLLIYFNCSGYLMFSFYLSFRFFKDCLASINISLNPLFLWTLLISKHSFELFISFNGLLCFCKWLLSSLFSFCLFWDTVYPAKDCEVF